MTTEQFEKLVKLSQEIREAIKGLNFMFSEACNLGAQISVNHDYVYSFSEDRPDLCVLAAKIRIDLDGKKTQN